MFGSRPDRLLGESVVAIYLDGQGPDHSLREFANRSPERRVLGRKFEVQLRR